MKNYINYYKYSCLLCNLMFVRFKCKDMFGRKKYVVLGILIILYNLLNLVLISVCLLFGASGFKFGSCSMM